MTTRIEVGIIEGQPDVAGRQLSARIASDLGIECGEIRVIEVYSIDKELSADQVERICVELFADPLIQKASAKKPYQVDFDQTIEVGFLPGVTDNVATTSRSAIADLLGVKFTEDERVFTSKRYCLSGIDTLQAIRIASWLANPQIETSVIVNKSNFEAQGGTNAPLPKVSLPPNTRVDEVDLELPDAELILLGKQGIPEYRDGKLIGRRGPLALDLASLLVIRDHYRELGRKPTDVEMESIAQTWSEHCKHRIFAGQIDEVDSLYRTYIKGATKKIRDKMGDDDWCVSVFSDNSGTIRFDDEYNICYKVETHNSPSALDPYGGAITGIVGVNRDPLGTGLGALLVANMYGYCFGDPFYKKPLPFRDPDLTKPILHPKVIFEGVRRGVEHGGNKSGIPTPYGFLTFDNRYMGKPLVFVGTVGILPRELNGEPSENKSANPGDLIVMAGGRIGKDGIHGATFSSESLHSGSPAGAVQIGDPITQKKLGDAQQEARDRGLYSSITDCGAGGISCSVGEMALESGGCLVELDRAPIKYVGIAPYEIWISESQERMTYAVPPEKIDDFLELMARRDVEATVIGTFTDSGKCTVKLNGEDIMDLDLQFFHNGVPGLKLNTEMILPDLQEPELAPTDLAADVVELAGRLNLCSHEYVTRQYDHEVQAGSVIKPLIGVEQDVHTDACVFRPLLNSFKGATLATGILPGYGDIDPYAMASCAIDTAVRNVIAIGAESDRIALLDNFCWCSSDEPHRLAQLKLSAQACYDVACDYGTPFISGKDSMFNDFKGFDADGEPIKISVPPTLLISSIARIADVRKCVTSDAKFSGDAIYLLGTTRNELGASEYYKMIGERENGEPLIGRNVPHVRTSETMPLYRALAKAIENGSVASAIGVGIGGLAYAAARCAMGGMLGLDIDLGKVTTDGELDTAKLLFSESQGRLMVTVAEQNKAQFEKELSGHEIALIGTVTDSDVVAFSGKGAGIEIKISDLKKSYKKTLDW
jgi:phosphoribosylformylglycinamidine synthase subunit PurSL